MALRHATAPIIVLACMVPGGTILAQPAGSRAAVTVSASADTASPWRIAMVDREEPGTRLTLRGTVFLPDGETPAAGVRLFVFHTDNRGHYSEDGMDESNPRLHGTVTTGPEGQYEIRTIRPGPYPGGEVAVHVHFVVGGDGLLEEARILYFDGDDRIPQPVRDRAASLGRFANVRPLIEEEDGSYSCTYDVVMEKP